MECVTTTIAWDGKTVAADGQARFAGCISDLDYPKIRKVGNVIYGATGYAPLLGSLIDWHQAGANLDTMPSPKDDDFTSSLLVFESGRCLHYSTAFGIAEELKPPFAWGCGAHFAIGALKAGATAKRAVEIAAECDPETGGVIVSMDTR